MVKMSEMIERVASALFDYDLHNHSVGGMGFNTTLNDLLPEYRDRYLAQARGAIEAMLEPTEVIAKIFTDASVKFYDYGIPPEFFANFYRTVIDTALKE
jgi:hypothetical protein